MNRKKYNIIISEDAFVMLDCHVEFLSRVSKEAAKRTMDRILSDIVSLEKIPERYPVYENRFISENRYRKMVSGKRYLVIYEISEDTVYVDYILDCRQEGNNIRLIER